MTKDLRELIDTLEEAGEIIRIKKEVDPLSNLGGIAWFAQNKYNKASLFESLKGFPGWTAVSYICGSRKRFALALGSTPENLIPDMSKKLEKGLTPIIIKNNGPCHDIIMKGNQVDLTKIPIHIHTDQCAGRYIGSGLCNLKDPDTGKRNVSQYRLQVKGPNKLGIWIYGDHGNTILRKHEEKGIKTPIAIAIGHHSSLYIANNFATEYGIDELEIAGTLIDEPIEMIKCITQDIEAPAYSEIVIEGEIPPNIRELEGPFTEHLGYAFGEQINNPIINVTAITMRKNAIYYALQGGRPISESQPLDGLQIEINMYRRLKQYPPTGGNINVKDVVCPPYFGDALGIIIKFTPEYEGQSKDVLLAALSQERHPLIAILVDDDVDPHDPKDVFWSIATRVDPTKDILVIDGVRYRAPGSVKYIYPAPKRFHDPMGLGAKLGIDATKPSTSNPKCRELFTRSIPFGLDTFSIEEFFKNFDNLK